MSRTFVIGDVHGANKALVQVLEKVNFDFENDTLISLGDIADGWSEVPECVDTLLKIKNLIAIRGNHDVWCHDWFKTGDRPLVWTQQGGQATIDAYIRTGQLKDKAHYEFWTKKQIDWFIDKKNNLFIHGGWDYTRGFPKGAAAPVMAGSIARECHWDRSVLRAASWATTFKPLEQFRKVFIGHTATSDALPHKYLNLWNLDSGAGWSGRLTIMNLETEKYEQSDFVKELYPNEKGR